MLYPKEYFSIVSIYAILIFLPYYINIDISIVFHTLYSSPAGSVLLYGNDFPPLKIFCYDLPEKYHPDNQFLRNYMYSPDSVEFKYYIEVEVHKELLLSPLITSNPEEADFFYIPVYLFAMYANQNFTKLNFKEIISELRRAGPWFDRKNGSDHIITSGFDFQWYGHQFLSDFLQTKIIYCALYPIFRNSWMDFEYKRFIVVPHISYFPKYPFDKVDWNRKRKNKAFLAQTFQSVSKANKLRMKVANAIKQIKNHDLIIFTRNKSDVIKNIKTLPEHYMDSDFCICPKGDNPIAKRNFDGPHFGCIPVYISDGIVLPFYGNMLDYSKFSIQIPEKDVKLIPKILESYTDDEILQMRKELKKCAKMYLFRLGEPPRVGEGFWAISWMWYTRYAYSIQFDIRYNLIHTVRQNSSSNHNS